MCVVLEADFIVGLAVKNQAQLKIIFHEDGPIFISASDCLSIQERCKRCGCGNVISLSTREDFNRYFFDNPSFFRQTADDRFEVITHNLSRSRSINDIDYDKFLYIGVYSSYIKKIFDYPRATLTT